ncbi:MAG: histidine kinase [Clostridia bacterium]
MSSLFDRFLDKLHVEESIRKRLQIAFVVIMLIMLLPAVVSLMVLQNYGNQYHTVISRVGQVARLRPLISSTLPDELFMVVAGKETVEETETSAYLLQFEQQLAELMKNNGDQTELLVVDRTLDTLKEYVTQLLDMAKQEASVSEQEKMLDEIRAVAGLMGNMLDDYVTLEIKAAETASGRLQSSQQFLLLGVGLFLALACIFAALAQRSLSNAIRSPIANLETLAAKLASGNLQARAQTIRTEELVPLSNSLNAMADKLEHLIEENKLEQENLKKSEMRTLQAQITPHFLYNTLDAIVWLAQTDRAEEAVKVTKAMSRFFRISLSQGRDWITIQQEVGHIESYLIIQKVRYRDILTYEIDVDPELYSFEILKLTIQPLVENAIYHGVKHRREGGRVVIRGARKQELLYISVEDNGVGMSQQRLETVRAMMDERIPMEDDGSGFGLYNVNKRIRLYYGVDKGLQIESGDKGTCVYFVVPLRS